MYVPNLTLVVGGKIEGVVAQGVYQGFNKVYLRLTRRFQKDSK
jgi:hypothetical protein